MYTVTGFSPPSDYGDLIPGQRHFAKVGRVADVSETTLLSPSQKPSHKPIVLVGTYSTLVALCFLTLLYAAFPVKV